MERYDRLTTLIDRFKLTVTPTDISSANLVVVAEPDGTPSQVLFLAGHREIAPFGGQILFCAFVDWNGPQNPLLTALPETVELDLFGDSDSMRLIRMMQSEIAALRRTRRKANSKTPPATPKSES